MKILSWILGVTTIFAGLGVLSDMMLGIDDPTTNLGALLYCGAILYYIHRSQKEREEFDD